MSCKRLYYGNAVYHVIFRGNNRQNILKLKSDKQDLLSSIRKYQERKGFKIYGFVLMDNHVHLIMEVCEENNISKVMQVLLLSYSTKYRRKYPYVGHVWQGRFKSKPIMNEGYFIENLNYIHNNPVRAGMVSNPSEYIYSSAKFYQGIKNKEMDEYIKISRYGAVLPQVCHKCLRRIRILRNA